MSVGSRPRLPSSGLVTRRMPWYAACILIPMSVGWSPQQILLLALVVVIIIVLAPSGARV